MNTETRISSFPPIIDENSKILILGSVPGVKSLEMQQYYAHPQNRFWKILFEIFQKEFSTDYEDRKKLLKTKKIALWDVIDTCERKGSLDSDIRNEEANSIAELLENHPAIQAIFCNGQKSHKNLMRILGKEFHIPVFVLPSTSPANAGILYLDKLKAWKSILQFL